MKFRRVAIIALAATMAVEIGAGSARPAQETAPTQQPLRVATRLVQIDVIVQDKQGNPVTGLTKDDFGVLDNKTPQTIELFSTETNQVLEGAGAPLPADSYTNEIQAPGVPSNLTVILLDSFNTGYMDQANARSQIARLLRTIRAEDRVAIYTLGAELRVLHEFTSDAASLAEALGKYTGERAADADVAKSKPTTVTHKNLDALAKQEGISEDHAFALDHWHATAEALRIIADHVSALPGRKNLVWVSGSFPFSIESNNLQRATNGQAIPFATDVELALRALTDANVAVYPVDTHGLMADDLNEQDALESKDQDTPEFGDMLNLARRTGGIAFYNTNGIKTSIRQVIDDTRVTYQLGFYPSDGKWDGSFHEVRVKVNRPDVRVQAREGYFALTDPKVAPQTRAEMIFETAKSPVEATGIRIHVQVTPVKLPGEKKLRLSVSLDTAQFQFEKENEHWNDVVEAVFIQLDDKDQIVQTAPMRFPLALDSKTYEQVMKQGLSFAKELPIVPNAAGLQVIVRDDGNGKVGSVHIPLAQ
jgi:VWFA-related protein